MMAVRPLYQHAGSDRPVSQTSITRIPRAVKNTADLRDSTVRIRSFPFPMALPLAARYFDHTFLDLPQRACP